MPQFMMIYDLVEKNGRTIKENNLDRQHALPVGSLVEVRDEDTQPDQVGYMDGVRLYVLAHWRDCNGTPLYVLGPHRTPRYPIDGDLGDKLASGMLTGFPEECLTLIRQP